MPRFTRHIGIDYSGAQTTKASLPGLRVYASEHGEIPAEVPPPPSPRKYWTRLGLAEWLKAELESGPPTLVGIDHGFSFPAAYFEAHQILPTWDCFLNDFHAHWPTHEPLTYVDCIRDGRVGNASVRQGNSRWRRITEQRCRSAKSVFHFDVPGSVAKSTHAGLPWLWMLRRHFKKSLHFWPFDGWEAPADRSVLVEAYPSLCSHLFPRESRTPDQHDAYSIARWMAEADAAGTLDPWFTPSLTPDERETARFEGWIFGVA